MQYSNYSKIYDFHFAALCAVATWGDGTLSQDEYHYLNDKIDTWWQDNSDYDRVYEKRIYFVETLKSIHTNKSKISETDIKDYNLLEEIVLDNIERIKELFSQESIDDEQGQDLLNSFYKDFVELSLSDGDINKNERKIINNIRKSFSIKSKNPFI